MGPGTLPVLRAVFLAQHYFTVNFSHENQKALELRTEDAKDRDEWVAAIAHARHVHPGPRARAKPRERGCHGGGDGSWEGAPEGD